MTDYNCDNIKQFFFSCPFYASSNSQLSLCYLILTQFLNKRFPEVLKHIHQAFWGRNIKLNVISMPFRPYLLWTGMSTCKRKIILPSHSSSGAEDEFSSFTPRLSLSQTWQVSTTLLLTQKCLLHQNKDIWALVGVSLSLAKDASCSQSCSQSHKAARKTMSLQ